MAKNPRRQLPSTPPPASSPVFSLAAVPASAKKCVAAGLLSVILGFALLRWTDPAGQNWASTLSPLLLVVGYGLIGVGLYQIDSK